MGKVFIIADPGSCHEGNIEEAYTLCMRAQVYGADAIKFQYWSDARKLATQRGMPEMERAYRKYRLPKTWLRKLKKLCNELGIEFMCTVYLPEDVETIMPYTERFKVSHLECSNLELLCKMYATKRQVVLSRQSGDRPCWIRSISGAMPDYPLIDMLCVSKYPAKISDYMQFEKWCHRDKAPTGISDHTQSVSLGGIFARNGTRYIEKHLRLDDTPQSNPDFCVAIPPVRFGFYVECIREMEKIDEK